MCPIEVEGRGFFPIVSYLGRGGGVGGGGGENYDFQKMPNKHSVTWLQKSSTSHFVAKTVMLFRSDIFAQQVSVPVHTEVFTSTGSNFMHFCQKPVLDSENVNIKKMLSTVRTVRRHLKTKPYRINRGSKSNPLKSCKFASDCCVAWEAAFLSGLEWMA